MEVINFHQAPTSCVVCGTTSPSSNYVDLTLVSSRTSQSDTPVREKVRTIIGEKWMAEQREDPTMVMCHQCFHLVDQFDALEAQLRSVKAELCDKYFAYHGSPTIVVDHGGPYQRLDQRAVGQQHGGGGHQRVKRTAAASRNRAAGGNVSGKRKRGAAVLETREQNLSLQTCLQVDNRKDKAEAILQWHNAVLHPFEQTPGPLPELAVPSQQLTDRETEHIITSLNNAVAESTAWRPPPTQQQQSPCLQQQQSAGNRTVLHHHHDPVSEDEAQDGCGQQHPEVVYDHLPGLLVPGERLRVGALLQGEDGGLSYRCCYCGDLFAERIVLSSHVHSHHRPEVLTAQVPAELGLGAKLNCGVQLSNVTSEMAKPFACIFCDSAFKFKSNVHLHFKEKHTPHKPFSCMDCGEAFRRSMELSRHRVYYCSFRKKARAGGDKKSK